MVTLLRILATVSLICSISAYKLPESSAKVSQDVVLEDRFELPHSRHSDVGLKVPELVTKYGYPLETHEVITPDGYILTIHRIPHGKNNSEETDKPVVFLFHGLICSSADWVLMGPEKGLGYLLADRGYDVWMGNARGNTYSRHHVTYNPDIDKEKFWNFSWHEIGKIDTPTMIDYVLNSTGVSQVFYIAHSQGATSFFVMTSELPEYNEKIKLMVGLAPVAYASHMTSYVVKAISFFAGTVEAVSKYLGQYEFLPSSTFMQILTNTLCHDESILKDLCSNILFLVAGYDKAELNETMVPVILSNTPAGSSTKQILHFVQLYKSDLFSQYDYGTKEENEEHYGPGMMHPPNYKLERVSAPVAMFYGQNDLLSAEEDVLRLHESLPHVVRTVKISYPLFSHLDFLWSIDVVKLLYNDVFELLNRYQ